jgi:hypothetical protein
MSTKRTQTGNRRDKPPTAQKDKQEDKPGTNATQPQPDPKAEPIPGRQRPWHPRSPYTTGND